jgi:acyl-CoA thioesterase
VAALIGAIIDEAGFDPAFTISRTTLDILGKVPNQPLVPRITPLRSGRQMQLHRVELLVGIQPVAQSHVLLVRALETPDELPPFHYPPPDSLEERLFLIGATMAGAIRTRPIQGGVREPGRGITWLAMEGEVISGTPPSPFVKACLFSDFGNGVGSVTDRDEWSFANLDITVNFLRMPRGEWILLDAHTVMAGNGHGVVENIFADTEGIYARGTQTVFIGPSARR